MTEKKSECIANILCQEKTCLIKGRSTFSVHWSKIIRGRRRRKRWKTNNKIYISKIRWRRSRRLRKKEIKFEKKKFNKKVGGCQARFWKKIHINIYF